MAHAQPAVKNLPALSCIGFGRAKNSLLHPGQQTFGACSENRTPKKCLPLSRAGWAHLTARQQKVEEKIPIIPHSASLYQAGHLPRGLREERSVHPMCYWLR